MSASTDLPFPFASPLGDRMTWGHLCVTNQAIQNSSYDALSYNLLQNHNVYIHTKAIIDANRIGKLDAAEASRWCDYLVFNARDAIDAVFAADNPMKALERNKSVLQKVCGSRTAQSAWDVEDDAR